MRKILTVIGALYLATFAYSATLWVPTKYSTIQKAINASSPGDTIAVLSGTYYENIDFMGKAIHLGSVSGPDETVIDGRQNGSVVRFGTQEGRNSIIEGFTITNGTGETTGMGGKEGGGIWCVNSSPTIRLNVITRNEPGSDFGYGGGIYCCDGSPMIQSNVISHNQKHCRACGDGCGIYLMGQTGNPVVSGNRIEKNGRDGVGGGGGVFCSGISAMITGNVISNNRNGTGGGVYVVGGESIIQNNQITYNTTGSNGIGGGMYLANSSTTIANNVIAGNRSEGTGGGISCSGSDLCTVVNCTIVGNSSMTGESGGLSLPPPESQKVVNSIIWGNDGLGLPGEMTGNSTVTFCNVRGGWTGTGNINHEPHFANPGINDFHLTWNSPCRDAGDNTAVAATEDFEGDPRVVGTVDIGADEFHFHLYTMCYAHPGSAFNVEIIGPPSRHVLLALGDGIRVTPVATIHGDLWLKLPLAKSWQLGPIPSTGILTMNATVPSGWPSGSTHPFQALVGPWGGGATRLTNVLELEVE